MNQPAFEPFAITRHAIDPRADGARRTVRVTATHVTIERAFKGVRMRVAVPVAAYRGLVIALHRPNGSAVLTLRHDDSDLDVALYSGSGLDVAHQARSIGALLAQSVSVEESYIVQRDAIARREPPSATPPRRSRFATRRKTGVLARLETTFTGETEIIARS